MFPKSSMIPEAQLQAEKQQQALEILCHTYSASHQNIQVSCQTKSWNKLLDEEEKKEGFEYLFNLLQD